jgi:hypothetical protein
MEGKIKQKNIFVVFMVFIFLLKMVKIQFTWWRTSPKLALGLKSDDQDPLHTYLTRGQVIHTWRGDRR